MNIEPSLLEILACPACHSPLTIETLPDAPKDADPQELVCTNSECRRAYPVRDDIPVLLIDEARILPVAP
ncbi:MAG TPA: Trm112 family protein [Acidothermaceae bacterium]